MYLRHTVFHVLSCDPALKASAVCQEIAKTFPRSIDPQIFVYRDFCDVQRLFSSQFLPERKHVVLVDCNSTGIRPPCGKYEISENAEDASNNFFFAVSNLAIERGADYIVAIGAGDEFPLCHGSMMQLDKEGRTTLCMVKVKKNGHIGSDGILTPRYHWTAIARYMTIKIEKHVRTQTHIRLRALFNTPVVPLLN